MQAGQVRVAGGVQQFPRIEQIVRIQRGFNPPHQRQRNRIVEARKFVDLHLPDPVFGADRPAPLRDQIIDPRADCLAFRFLPHPAHSALGGEDVEVDIAIAKMPESDRAGAGKRALDRRRGGEDEFGHRFDRD